ncbi:copper chaperone PCu(A)C [Paracoccus sp. (in: a-proteobacteria)]|uniref:copper chaperone PCu(A)C n=1 Tax=Paracoccus sp. TaxID=267 RepID=UPI0028968B53|nr:copper chaperone PCu(A)C [Paracoccus sp. (in: a-proteobacteria)]
MKLFSAAMVLGLTAPAAFAQDCPTWQAGDLTILNAWSRATIGAERPAVFYADIVNSGDEDDALIGIATPVAGMPMLHETVVTDGVATMPHASRIPVSAGATVGLSPGGYHGMLMNLNAALTEGESFPLTLTFERAGDVAIDVGIAAVTARGPVCQTDDS